MGYLYHLLFLLRQNIYLSAFYTYTVSKRDQTNDIHLSAIHLERFDCIDKIAKSFDLIFKYDLHRLIEQILA